MRCTDLYKTAVVSTFDGDEVRSVDCVAFAFWYMLANQRLWSFAEIPEVIFKLLLNLIGLNII